MSLATALPAVVLLAILVGAGDGLFNAGVVPTLSATTGVEAHREVFARYNRALNAGMGVGAVVSGLLATLGGVGIVRALFVVAGVLFVPLALCVARMPAEDLVDNAEHNLDRGWGAAGGWRLLRVAATPILVQFAAFFLIFSQFEATAPLVARNLMHTVVYATPLMLVANTVAIVVLQSSVTAFVRRWKETTVLAACMALWCAGYLAAALCSPGPGAVRVVALVVLALIIAIGECMYACSFNPWLIRRVNQVDLPRVSAACSAALSLGAAVGPVFGVTLVAVGGSAVLVWLVLAGGCLAGCAATAGIAVRDRRALVPAESGATQ